MKKTLLLTAATLVLFTGCTERYVTEVYSTPGVKKGTQKVYSVNGNVYYPKKTVPIGWTQTGIASWYGPNFHGKYTSNGEIYNMYAFTAAHKTLPMDTMVKVTNLNNGKSVIVRINDRGPFVKGRIIDLSYVAAKQIGVDRTGTAPVRITVIGFKGKNYVNGYMIQVGAFLHKGGAEYTAQKYRELGYNTSVLKKGDFYKVFIVGFKTYSEAKRFKLSHKLNGFIVGE
ncbi:septal ring lytic transglycosylase RlpA family lipoprotein [Nautilia sp. PV-1]|uniref:septal ring lytic transglycosylase RlpA family protein n=1 Tax=Nautilia sp. PV-1 TaxID=2579250 RepID=UPI000FD94CAC|nr:septal ring lytic transglycosylase RlpA family protein [Nautilia sp. PV-1]AZV46899.1 septal ring lytic transglycosylase RlpA family lipoprotein [Nautilia sp. PV-1]